MDSFENLLSMKIEKDIGVGVLLQLKIRKTTNLIHFVFLNSDDNQSIIPWNKLIRGYK